MIVTVIHVLIIGVMIVAAFLPQVFVGAKASGVYVPFLPNTSDWGSQVCKFMTVGGCAYFTSYELAAAWGYLASIEATVVEMVLVEPVVDLGNDQGLWKVEFVIVHGTGDVESHQAYVVMSDGLLDRVVSLDQILIVEGLPWN
jgi:hypothetical protein